LFDHDSHEHWEVTVRDMLVANAIYHYDDFYKVVAAKPDEEFDAPLRHTYIARFNHALNMAQVSQETFVSWKKEIRDGFVNRNISSLPYPEIEERAGTGTRIGHLLVDPRNFVEQTNNLVANYHSLQHSYTKIKDQLDFVNDEVVGLRTENTVLTEKVEALVDEQQRSTQVLLAMYQSMRGGQSGDFSLPCLSSAVITPSQSPNSKRKANDLPGDDESNQEFPYVPFSCTSKFMNGQSIELSRQFVYFFSNQAHKAYEKEKTTEDWRDKMPKNEKKRITNKMKSLKEIVRFMILVTGLVPDDPPLGDPPAYQEWSARLREMAKEAEEKVFYLLYGEKLLDDTTTPCQVKNCQVLKSPTFQATKEARIDNNTDYIIPGTAPLHILEFFDPKERARKRQRVDEENAEGPDHHSV